MKFNYANIMLLQKIRYIVFIVLLLNLFNIHCQTGLGIHTVVIDPGHGGKDPGAIGAKKNMEKTVVLNVSLMLGDLIKKNFPDVKVVYTRDNDRFIGLARRAKIANEIGADLFISIHANAAENRAARGFESWVLGLHRTKAALEVAKFENSAILMEDDHEQTYEEFNPNDPDAYIALSMRQNAFLDQSLVLANSFQKDCEKKLGLKNRGVKQAGFMVLYRATMPAVLIELGFLSHAEEELFLASKKGQIKLANHIYEGFKSYKSRYDGVDESLQNTLNENTITTQPVDEKGQIFKVQLATSSTKISTEPQNFNGLKGVEVYLSGKFYKYTYGICKQKSEASKYLQEAIDAGYDTAFIVSFDDGRRLDWKKL